MKKTSIYSLILLGLFNNINSMEEAKEEDNLGNLEALPNEVRYEIVKSFIEDNINKWNDIFNFDNESLKEDLGRVRLISKGFTVFKEEELKNLIKNLKEKRFEHLKENIKAKYKDLSEEELNKKLTDLLNTLTSISKVKKLKECVKLIIAGANIDITNINGTTALMFAAIYDQAEIVKLLIAMGTNINITNNNSGNTALMYAAYSNHIEVVKLLIEGGANINIINKYGKTALMIAEERGHKDIVELLKSKGTK